MESHSDWMRRAIATAKKTVDPKEVEELTELFVRIEQLRETHPGMFSRLDRLTDEGQFDLARQELEKFERESE